MKKLNLLIKYKEFALNNNLKLNPDKKIVDQIIEGLVFNLRESGELYCPCRRITGNKLKDKDIICPCIHCKEEIKSDGQCFCGLFVKGD